MFIHDETLGKYVYHYTSSWNAREYILPKRSLRLGRYTQTNDPRESKTWSFNLTGTSLEGYTNAEFTWLSDGLKKHARLLCFCEDSDQYVGETLRQTHYRGFGKPRMWAQYAEGHAGVCLVFDRAKLLKCFEAQIESRYTAGIGKVQYRSHNPLAIQEHHAFWVYVDALKQLGQEAYMAWHMKHFFKDLFLEKMEDWRDENEWRLIAFSEGDGDLYLDYEDSLVGIVFSDGALTHDVLKMRELCGGLGVKYHKLVWQNHLVTSYISGDLLFMDSGIEETQLWREQYSQIQAESATQDLRIVGTVRAKWATGEVHPRVLTSPTQLILLGMRLFLLKVWLAVKGRKR